MSKNENQFYRMFEDSLRDFSPEVPTSVYDGIRGQMKKKSFFAFSATSLNIWYVLIAGTLVSGAIYSSSTGDSSEASMTKLTERIDEGIYRPNQHLASISETSIQEESIVLNETIASTTSDYTLVASTVVAKKHDIKKEVVYNPVTEETVIKEEAKIKTDFPIEPLNPQEVIIESPSEISTKHLITLGEIGKLSSSNVFQQVKQKEDKITLKLPVPVKQ